ncbi:DUF3604 domain-containing protein [Sinimarinibacterium sp. CAU 1509]|uniref:DUF3604 domain-containing protein n=1 Tax=Sinimarinibacterium sp. CAU 1509 TaxID=2562283 RepID=UPI0010AD257D|nr:DUF3604 domain-containing protein [Sinimarinibacterium sp. CAU 1509]TJY62265.1 DUF3604 domain-containing protein [Sinimarinibacterium sp. CAU 1509]
MSVRIQIATPLAALMLAACGASTTPENLPTAPGQPGSVAGDCGPLVAGQKQALFGDLHVHTSDSFDTYFFNSINGPRDAIRFAKGEPAGYPAGDDDPNTPDHYEQLDRPLDFVAITDHAEFLGAFKTLCELNGTVPAGTNPACEIIGNSIRGDIRAFVEGRTTPFQIALQALLAESPTDRPAWAEQQRITDEEYQPCTFSTLHGYEYSSNKRGQMLHRNVIFRGDADQVPDVVYGSATALTGIDDRNANDEWMLFDHLQDNCGGMPDCRVLTIPHSANLSDGRFFMPRDFATGLPPGRDGVALTQADAELRRGYDRVLEIYQHKGASECAAGLEGNYLEGEETHCDFELTKNVCAGQPDDPPGCARYCTGDPAHDPSFCSLRQAPTYLTRICETVGPDGASGPADNCTAPLDYFRNAMAEGFTLRALLGVNPYRQGIIASTDTHNGTPGMVRERRYPGHGGVLEDEPKDHLGQWDCDNSNRAINPEDPADPDNCTNRVFLDRARGFGSGGLAGVWTAENTREQIWDAVYRGETFGTSGPRIRIRMQSSWTPPPDDICARLAQGGDSVTSTDGAIMGGDLPQPPAGATAPYLTVWAIQDPGGDQPGLPLQGLDVIKGTLNASGEPKVHVYENVAKTPHPVEQPAADCSVAPGNHPEQFCVTWQDPDFHADRDAYWYARVREIPSCRWSTYLCVSSGVDCAALSPANGIFPDDTGWHGYEGCCRIEGEPGSFHGSNIFSTLEERAWASPVWFEHP